VGFLFETSVAAIQNRPDGSGMASSLCGFSGLCSFCGCLLTLLDDQLLAIRTDSRPFLYDERQTVLSYKNFNFMI